MMLVDAHCHLQDERIGAGIDALIARAREAGVSWVVCCGTEERDWQDVLGLKEKYPGFIVPSFGLHPWSLKERSKDWEEELERFLGMTPSGVGEIGLDHAVDIDHAEQEEVFLRQLMLAIKLQRPVSIHCRRAWDSLLAVLEKTGPLESGGIVHSYSGAPEAISLLGKLGLSVSFSCSITRSGNKKGRRALLAAPMENLLIETDSPDIMPVGVKGLNEPANLILVLQTAA
ncbi:MAG: TatD family hydrolase, partial [Candidatus Omnitrophica bacterium]|nr:TatD family hydrolase [Candidatus Omnitrophota bacterium]